MTEIEECDCDACSGECPELVERPNDLCLACRHGRHPVTEEE
jgi:hypothetical protein